MSFRPPRPQALTIPGPAGGLQAILEDPQAATVERFVVVCHPHPQFGGTLDNKVVHTLARSFQELGLPTLRFNFRGVGTSQGSYAHGIGETDDAIAVVDWGAKRWPGAQFWLAGFSFGGFVAVRAAAERHPERLITVAPPVQRFDFETLRTPTSAWLVIQGDSDEIVDAAEVMAWTRRLSSSSGSSSGPSHWPPPQVVTIPGATHFFHGKLTELKTAVQGWVKSAGAEKQQP